MQVLTEIAFPVLHQAHQPVSAGHGFGTIVMVVGIGEVMALRVGEAHRLEHTMRKVGTSFVSGLESRLKSLIIGILRRCRDGNNKECYEWKKASHAWLISML